MQSQSPNSTIRQKNYAGSSTSPKETAGNGQGARAEFQLQETQGTPVSEGEVAPPQPPPKDTPEIQSALSPSNEESYFNLCSTSSTSSIVSLSKISLAGQLSTLSSLQLPDADSFSIGISSIPTAPKAARAFGNAAEQMRRWLGKANDILTTMDAEDDVDWAAAGGREGLEGIEKAIGRFEGLVHRYVKAIEDLQERPDIAEVPSGGLEALVDQMEVVLGSWNKVRNHLKTVKTQVELAMEWEELWNVVLRDITREVDNLNLLIFEMEEKRCEAPSPESMTDNIGLDVQELETIVEEAPTNAQIKANHRFSLPAAFSADSPLTSPGFAKAQDDSNLMALFARMQPLRASLDFLPMTLSSFRSRAEQTLPSACKQLENRRKALEKEWKVLERDAELVRRELSEDRWVVVFRNAGRQADKLCESVERSISKLRESIDAGAHHVNPATLAKKIESYEAKKMHYGPAVERVLVIIEKGVKDRQTINGEVLRLHLDTRARWRSLETQMKELDLALEDLHTNKNQQLRDSISTIVSMDRSAPGSTVDTPGSSPASSVMGTPNGPGDSFPSGTNGASRRGSLASHSASRSSSTRRVFTAPGMSNSSQVPRKTQVTRSITSDNWSMSRGASPSPYSKQHSSTPTPGSRSQRPSLSSSDNKPRWNSSPKIEHNDFRPSSRTSSQLTSPTGRKSSLSFRSPSSAGFPYPSGLPLPSPLGRCETSSPVPRSAPSSLPHRPRLASGAQSSFGHRQPSTPTSQRMNTQPAPRQTPAIRLPSTRLESLTPQSPYTPLPSSTESAKVTAEPLGSPEQPSPSKRAAAAKASRPSTAMAGSRRVSMLPQPKKSTSPLINNGTGRESAIGRK
ncbi:MAG: hypothetical protein LQ343_006379 [Gyalolechia ehrenbergii]|nr:MAG: hypothetical protein LQ343_006379 [Gyalolechia ehrenbergii]